MTIDLKRLVLDGKSMGWMEYIGLLTIIFRSGSSQLIGVGRRYLRIMPSLMWRFCHGFTALVLLLFLTLYLWLVLLGALKSEIALPNSQNTTSSHQKDKQSTLPTVWKNYH